MKDDSWTFQSFHIFICNFPKQDISYYSVLTTCDWLLDYNDTWKALVINTTIFYLLHMIFMDPSCLFTKFITKLLFRLLLVAVHVLPSVSYMISVWPDALFHWLR